jgi:multidrug efflux pump subunit AcrB
MLTVNKQPGANVIETVDQIKAQLPRLMANIPPAITVETVLDRTTTIRASVEDVEFTLVLTIGLVVLVVLLFLRNLWATAIPSMTVILSLLGSFAAMYALNFSLDNISLMALTIAIGFVVDDAIVVVENIYRHIEEGLSPGGSQGFARDFVYRPVHKPVTGCRVHPAAFDGRHCRAHVSRICGDGNGLDPCLRIGIADVGAHAVLSLHAARK